ELNAASRIKRNRTRSASPTRSHNNKKQKYKKIEYSCDESISSLESINTSTSNSNNSAEPSRCTISNDTDNETYFGYMDEEQQHRFLNVDYVSCYMESDMDTPQQKISLYK